MMKFLIVIPIFLICAAGVIAGIGLALPESYSIERSIDIEAETEVVFSELSDLENWPTWFQSNVELAEIADCEFGDVTAGESASMSWKEDGNQFHLELTEVIDNESITFVIKEGDKESLTGTITVERPATETEDDADSEENADDDSSDDDSSDDDSSDDDSSDDDSSDDEEDTSSASEDEADSDSETAPVITSVSIVISGTVASDPMSRWTGLFAPSLLGKRFDNSLVALSNKINPPETDEDESSDDASDDSDDQSAADDNAQDDNAQDDNAQDDDAQDDDAQNDTSGDDSDTDNSDTSNSDDDQ